MNRILTQWIFFYLFNIKLWISFKLFEIIFLTRLQRLRQCTELCRYEFPTSIARFVLMITIFRCILIGHWIFHQQTLLHSVMSQWILRFICIQHVKPLWGKCLSCFRGNCWQSPCYWTPFVQTTCLATRPGPSCPRLLESSLMVRREQTTHRILTVNGWSKVSYSV